MVLNTDIRTRALVIFVDTWYPSFTFLECKEDGIYAGMFTALTKEVGRTEYVAPFGTGCFVTCNVNDSLIGAG